MIFSSILKSFGGIKSKPAGTSTDGLGIVGGDTIEGARVLKNSCYTCRWWNSAKPTVCEAFPNGIPLLILLGDLDHTVPYKDEDLQYEPSLSTRVFSKKGLSVSKNEGDFEELHPRYPKGGPNGGKFMPKGSPEYLAARKDSLERFSAPKYTVGRSSGDTPESYFQKSNIKKIREGHQLVSKLLTPEQAAAFHKASSEVEQDRLEGKESFKEHSKPSAKDPNIREYSPERLKLHNEIIAGLLAGSENKHAKDGEKPEFIIIGGVAGSGKSKFGEGPTKVYDEATHVRLDNDEIKSKLTGYTPEKATLFHVEAADILEKALHQAKAEKLNIALDATMSSSEKPYIEQIHSQGYNVSVHYMHISPMESAGRAIKRWLNYKNGKPQLDANGKEIRGRLVPTFRILGMVDNLKHFDEARKMAEKWSFSRNNVPSGAEPIKIISSNPT